MENKPIIISIEGNIGIGKSTLLDNLEKYIDNNSIIILREPVEKWLEFVDDNGESILSNYYNNPTKYGFPFQMIIMKTMFELISTTIESNPSCSLIICERSLSSSHYVFAKMFYDDNIMNKIEYDIYEKFFHDMGTHFIPDKVIHLQASSNICFHRIEKRRRKGESKIELMYLDKCQKYHEIWLDSIQSKIPILKLQMDQNITCADDKITLSHIDKIIDFISK